MKKKLTRIINNQEYLICAPKGDKYFYIYKFLCLLNKKNFVKMPSRKHLTKKPPIPPSRCIGGNFCGCLSYDNTEETYLRDFYKIIDWCRVHGLYDSLLDILSKIENEDLIMNPILINDLLVPDFYLKIYDYDGLGSQLNILIKADEIKKIQENESFPPFELSYKIEPWNKEIWKLILKKDDDSGIGALVHLPSHKMLNFKVFEGDL